MLTSGAGYRWNRTQWLRGFEFIYSFRSFPQGTNGSAGHVVQIPTLPCRHTLELSDLSLQQEGSAQKVHANYSPTKY
jgi:hypothetical protein